MFTDIHFRNASISDYDFGYLAKKLALGPYIAQTWGWDENEQLSFYKKEFNIQSAFIVISNNTEVGWLDYRISSMFLDLRQIYILPDFQNNGIGKFILEYIIELSKVKHIPILLQVLKCNLRAFALYKRYNFEIQGETPTHYLMKRVFD